MRLHSALALVMGAVLLTACSFTLAADVTPPPDYVPPTPMPTLGAMYPASAPDINSGETIFAQNCAPCHGVKGLGDGPQSMQLPVTVPGIGLADVARSASPAAWFKIVTQGNLDRFMPPFVGALSDQQRWNVVAYALTLHTAPEQIAQGQSLVQADCPDCAAKFKDQTKMATLSESDLVAIIRNGEGDIPAFGKAYSDADAFAAAAYLRSLTFTEAPEVVAATPSAVSTQAAGTSEAGATSSSATAVTSAAGIGTVTGSIEASDPNAAVGLTATLHGFDHSQDQTAGPQEVLTLSAPVAADGSFSFENVEMPENRIFLADVKYAGIEYRSDFAAAPANSTSIALPPLKLYEPSSDVSLLKVSQVHIYTDFGTAGTVQVLEIFAFSNSSNNSVVISTDGTTIPFIRLPEGAQNSGYEAGQDSAPYVAADKGLAVVPSDKPYSIIAFFNLPYDKKLEIKQPMAIDAASILLLVPEGVHVEARQLEARGLQVIQNNNYQEFSSSGLKAGDTLSLSLSGQPSASPAGAFSTRQGILIGGGVLGLVLIIGGVVLYLRERRRLAPTVEEAEYETSEDIMDAILALDDLHRARKISDDAYHTRREQLKDELKRLG